MSGIKTRRYKTIEKWKFDLKPKCYFCNNNAMFWTQNETENENGKCYYPSFSHCKKHKNEAIKLCKKDIQEQWAYKLLDVVNEFDNGTNGGFSLIYDDYSTFIGKTVLSGNTFNWLEENWNDEIRNFLQSKNIYNEGMFYYEHRLNDVCGVESFYSIYLRRIHDYFYCEGQLEIDEEMNFDNCDTFLEYTLRYAERHHISIRDLTLWLEEKLKEFSKGYDELEDDEWFLGKCRKLARK